MWSGPRNVSTALMRSWGNREDTVVIDEPLYAHYLAVTGRAHPGREQVIAHHETNWRRVVEMLLGPQPPGTRIFYQKQMSHHLLPDIGREWLSRVTNAFLIRDPRAMLASLAEKLEEFTLADTGLPQQVEIFDHVLATTGRVPPVVDSADLLAAPEPCCGGSARRSTCRSASGCSPGRPAGEIPTGSGRHGGTRASRSRPGSRHHLRDRPPDCRRSFKRSRRNAGPCMTSSGLTD